MKREVSFAEWPAISTSRKLERNRAIVNVNLSIVHQELSVQRFRYDHDAPRFILCLNRGPPRSLEEN